MTHVDSGPARNRTARGDVVDGADARDRHLLEIVVEQSPPAVMNAHQLGVDEPGLHCVHADAVLAELVGRDLHEHLDAGLARRSTRS